MSSLDASRPPELPRHATFPSTHWTWVDLAQTGSDSVSRGALEKLCAQYWYPLYVFVRRQGHQAEAARDLTQGFFERLVACEFLAEVHPAKGRLRSFLLAALTHYLSNERDRSRALRRGGGTVHVPWPADHSQEGFQNEPQEPQDWQTPSEEYDRRWGLTLLLRALESLRVSCLAEGWGERFELLKGGLLGGSGETRQEELAAQLGIPVATVKTSLHRLRRRLKECLRAEVAATVTDESEIDEELRYLLRLIARVT